MIKINLLSEGKRPAAVRKKGGGAKLEGRDLGQWMLLAGALIGLAAFGVSYWLQQQKNDAKAAEVATAQHEVDQLASVIKEVDDFKEKKAELERKIGVINDLKANQRGPVRVMDYVSRALPELLWLDTMTMKGDSIHLEGRAFNTNAVANFIDNLDKVPEFDEPTLKSTEAQAGGVYKFVVNLNFSFSGHKPGTPGATAASTTAPAPKKKTPRAPAKPAAAAE
ncbi:MAG TPA: PilN domain-containing protein [Thermoanaerobaculia bacterium]|jgi:type IV pilus assembly protein PilN|nr:PilN domain-containing protein [Thermoanaerobaculia bacterium]